jgi:hypothetical protein
MTEAEWLACEAARPMLSFLGERGSPRKLRLYACASCRSQWDRLERESSRKAVLTAEQFADGACPKSVLLKAGSAARGGQGPDFTVAGAARCCAYADALLAALFTTDAVLADRRTVLRKDAKNAQLAGLVRDVFGNPFGTSVLNRARLTPEAASLGQAAYEKPHLPSGHLDNARLAVLSDALEEAGCTHTDILIHLRSPGPHVRGCWALDLVLGKE